MGMEDQKLLIGQRILLSEHIHDLTAHHTTAPRPTGKERDRQRSHLGGYGLIGGGHSKSIQGQSVPRQESVGLAENLMARGSAAAEIIIVHAGQIVVDEREGVDHLHRRRKGQGGLGISAKESAELQSQGGAYPLASRHQGVSTGLVKHGIRAAAPSVQCVQKGFHQCSVLREDGLGYGLITHISHVAQSSVEVKGAGLISPSAVRCRICTRCSASPSSRLRRRVRATPSS